MDIAALLLWIKENKEFAAALVTVAGAIGLYLLKQFAAEEAKKKARAQAEKMMAIIRWFMSDFDTASKLLNTTNEEKWEWKQPWLGTVNTTGMKELASLSMSDWPRGHAKAMFDGFWHDVQTLPDSKPNVNYDSYEWTMKLLRGRSERIVEELDSKTHISKRWWE